MEFYTDSNFFYTIFPILSIAVHGITNWTTITENTAVATATVASVAQREFFHV